MAQVLEFLDFNFWFRRLSINPWVASVLDLLFLDLLSSLSPCLLACYFIWWWISGNLFGVSGVRFWYVTCKNVDSSLGGISSWPVISWPVFFAVSLVACIFVFLTHFDRLCTRSIRIGRHISLYTWIPATTLECKNIPWVVNAEIW